MPERLLDDAAAGALVHVDSLSGYGAAPDVRELLWARRADDQ